MSINRNIEALRFYSKLILIYKNKHGSVTDFGNVCQYFFGKLPTRSRKMRIVRSIAQKVPVVINLLFLKIISKLLKDCGRVWSAVIMEVAASIGAKQNTQHKITLYDHTNDMIEPSYYLNFANLRIEEIKDRHQNLPKHNTLVTFNQTEISALTLLDPYLLNALNVIETSSNRDHAHGSNYGWYKENVIEEFERKFSENFILPDLKSFSSFNRYLKAPSLKHSKPKVVWIGTCNYPNGLAELITGIDDFEVTDEWILKVKNGMDESVDIIHPHPDDTNNLMHHIAQIQNVPTKRFDISEVNASDKFIFHSINSSLIYYCLKYNLDFKIYSQKFSYENCTEFFFNFVNHLEQNGKVKFL